MNYKNNMDRYYMQAHYNKVKNKEKSRNIILWLLSLIGIFLLGLFFLYKTYNKIDEVNVSDSATVEKSSMERTSESVERESTIKAPQQEKVVSVGREISAGVKKREELEVEPTQKDRTTSKEVHLNENNINVKNRPGMGNSTPPVSIQAKAQKSLDEAKKSIDSKIKAIKESGAAERLASKTIATPKLDKEVNTTNSSINTLTSNLKTEKNNLSTAGKTTTTEQNESNKNTLLDKKSVIALENNGSTKVEDKNSTMVTTSKIDPNEPLFHIYIVSKGETITGIAIKEYNDRGMYQQIIDANPDLENPNSIREGDEILLPIVDEKKEYSDILNFK